MKQQESVISWLKDAYAMEVGATKTLEHHAEAAQAYPEVRTKLYEHLEETRRHAELVKGCLERLGSQPSAVKETLSTVMGAVQGVATLPAKDTVVKNALGDYAAEHFEIACYNSLLAAAEQLGDEETARVCRAILAEEERMASWLDGQIRVITQRYLTEQASKVDKQAKPSAQHGGQPKAGGVSQRSLLLAAGLVVVGVGGSLLLTSVMRGGKNKQGVGQPRPGSGDHSEDSESRLDGNGQTRKPGGVVTVTEVWLVPGPYSGIGPANYQASGDPVADEINSRLTQHGQIDASDIMIVVDSDHVLLQGTVADEETKQLVEQATQGLLGVSSVDNQLSVKTA